MHIPLRIGLLDEDGRELPLVLEGEQTGAEAPRTRVLDLRAATEEFRFAGIERKPVPSVLRGFSAPVRLGHGYSRDDLLFLMSHDRDPFCRWEAGQTLASQVILALVDDYRNDRVPEIDDEYLTAVAGIVTGGHTDRAHKAEMLTLPQETYISQLVAEIDPRAIHQARSFIRGRIAEKLTAEFLDLYKANTTNEPYSHSPEAIGRRRLRNICLSYLMYGGGGEALELCMGQFRNSSHMTDTLASLRCLAQTDFPERSEALGIFYDRWRDDPLVVDKWFAIQATSERSDTLDEVMALTGHPAFDLRNPNKLRALIGAFSMANPARFHDSSGAGYRFFADRIIELDKLNPRTAARLMAALERWRGYEPGRRRLMKAELERILAEPGLSTDVWEIATKSLERSPA